MVNKVPFLGHGHQLLASPRTAAPKGCVNVPFARVQPVAEMPVDAGSIVNYTTDFNRVTKQDVSEANLLL